jgi:hypothetical protein
MDDQDIINLNVNIENIEYRLSLIEKKLGIEDEYSK